MAQSGSNPTLPSHHVVNFSGTSYTNPWPSSAAPTWTDLLQQSFPLSWPKDTLHSHPKARELKVVKPDWGASSVKASGLNKSKCIIGTWLGHASTLVELPLVGTAAPGKSLWLLFDPMFSLRAGPTQWTGPRRFHDPPCQISDLPGCNAVFISHNHVSTLKDVHSFAFVLYLHTSCFLQTCASDVGLGWPQLRELLASQIYPLS
jgi:N-acyl-phosphatidylethanolamine-hydrolysing phospholipase D